MGSWRPGGQNRGPGVPTPERGPEVTKSGSVLLKMGGPFENLRCAEYTVIETSKNDFFE